MKRIPNRYFRPADLAPYPPPVCETFPVLPQELLGRLEAVATALGSTPAVNIPSAELAADPVSALFIALLQSFGAVTAEERGDSVQLSLAGPLATDLPHVLLLFLRSGFPMFDDWTRRSNPVPDRLCALELLHHIELQRVEHSRRTGRRPDVLHEIPVAFGLVKAYSKSRRQAVYLLELNKDWNEYNLIGGKQELQDGGDFRRTLLREIEEELGVPRNQVQLLPLTSDPLDAYSLTGQHGVLNRYPCMLFWVRFLKDLPQRPKDSWFTEPELQAMATGEAPLLMINTVYLDFIFRDLPGGLAALEYSLSHPVEHAPWYEALPGLLARHKEWIAGLLAILAAVAWLIKELLS